MYIVSKEYREIVKYFLDMRKKIVCFVIYSEHAGLHIYTIYIKKFNLLFSVDFYLY